jgi:hypothetical protein
MSRPEKSCLVLKKVDTFCDNPVLSLHFIFSTVIALHFFKSNKKLLLFACHVGMWETPSVFHISTCFSFFASFFLLTNLLLLFKLPELPPAHDRPGYGVRLFRRHHIHAAMWPNLVVNINSCCYCLAGLFHIWINIPK